MSKLLRQAALDLGEPLETGIGVGECARILCVCTETVRCWTNRGILPCWRTTGNQRRFSRRLIEQIRREVVR